MLSTRGEVGALQDGLNALSKYRVSHVRPIECDLRRARNYLRDQANRYLSHEDRGVRDLSIYVQSQLGDFEKLNG